MKRTSIRRSSIVILSIVILTVGCRTVKKTSSIEKKSVASVETITSTVSDSEIVKELVNKSEDIVDSTETIITEYHPEEALRTGIIRTTRVKNAVRKKSTDTKTRDESRKSDGVLTRDISVEEEVMVKNIDQSKKGNSRPLFIIIAILLFAALILLLRKINRRW